MYVSYPPDFAEALQGRLDVPAPLVEPPPPYLRNAAVEEFVTHAPPATISAENRKFVDESLQVLIDCKSGVKPKQSGGSILKRYYSDVIRYVSNADREVVQRSLDFMGNTSKFSVSQRYKELMDAQCLFNIGLNRPGATEVILHTLKGYSSLSDCEFVLAMRRAWPKHFFNGSAMNTLHATAQAYERGGGKIMDVRRGEATDFFRQLIQCHVSDPATCRSLSVMLTAPLGYVEEPTNKGITVWQNPAGPTTAQLMGQFIQTPDGQVLQQLSNSRKRAAESMASTASADLPTISKRQAMPGLSEASEASESSGFASPSDSGDDASQEPFGNAHFFPRAHRNQGSIVIQLPDQHLVPLQEVPTSTRRDTDPSPLQVVAHPLSGTPITWARLAPDDALRTFRVVAGTALDDASARVPDQFEAPAMSPNSAAADDLDALFNDNPCPGWRLPADLFSSDGSTLVPVDEAAEPRTASVEFDQLAAAPEIAASAQSTQAQRTSNGPVFRAKTIEELIYYLKAPPSLEDIGSGAWTAEG